MSNNHSETLNNLVKEIVEEQNEAIIRRIVEEKINRIVREESSKTHDDRVRRIIKEELEHNERGEERREEEFKPEDEKSAHIVIHAPHHHYSEHRREREFRESERKLHEMLKDLKISFRFEDHFC
ncbi:14387_t:CDS:1 [Dentiscutata heterogama]|uniref:14387_t:CDS:1 n=1 Tax=Dentiscutata heterogama TaxID=1316150 RepID=A0ACA9JWC9_9GLOM|nr:14387_t:CDS:1 [Dentiscutata heterogama]